MLAILTTHPIQYQVPLWQGLALDGRVPFEVWYLTSHSVQPSYDQQFERTFAWDLNMLEGYPHRLLKTAVGATPTTFWNCRLVESLEDRLRQARTTALWVQGWQVAAYWQAVWAANRVGVQVWLRGESNNLVQPPVWKRGPKRLVLGQLFKKVDQFLYIGTANRRLYAEYGVPDSRLHPAYYAVDNNRFARQAQSLRASRLELRGKWGIPADAFCVLFCGKLIPKKHPHDVLAAVELLQNSRQASSVHLLWVGSGELGQSIRDRCNVVYDADSGAINRPDNSNQLPRASFTGFLNQTEISAAYVVADCLVLPSDHGETWGLVANEAMACGLPCILSDRCGAAADFGCLPTNRTFQCGDTDGLAGCIADLIRCGYSPSKTVVPNDFSFQTTIESVNTIYSGQ